MTASSCIRASLLFEAKKVSFDVGAMPSANTLACRSVYEVGRFSACIVTNFLERVCERDYWILKGRRSKARNTNAEETQHVALSPFGKWRPAFPFCVRLPSQRYLTPGSA